jgi:hypothetical protein
MHAGFDVEIFPIGTSKQIYSGHKAHMELVPRTDSTCDSYATYCLGPFVGRGLKHTQRRKKGSAYSWHAECCEAATILLHSSMDVPDVAADTWTAVASMGSVRNYVGVASVTSEHRPLTLRHILRLRSCTLRGG